MKKPYTHHSLSAQEVAEIYAEWAKTPDWKIVKVDVENRSFTTQRVRNSANQLQSQTKSTSCDISEILTCGVIALVIASLMGVI